MRSHGRPRSRRSPTAPALLLLLAALLLLGCKQQAAPEPGPAAGDTWSLVAVDPESGDVGVAGASCVPVPIDALAALVPGQGAAAVQANFDLENRDRVFALLQAGLPAGEIVAEVTDPLLDPEAAVRQYGVITFGEGLETAAYTGADNLPWAGDRPLPEAAVTVQGNLLEGEAVVTDALAAFEAAEGPLPERLMQGLLAGSAAGGDRRCNEGGARQTAAAAFIMVAQAGQPPYAAPVIGVSQVGEPDTPWLYLSVSEPIGGENAVLLLEEAYQLWREGNLPAPVADRLPETEPSLPWPVLAALGLLLILVLLLVYGRRR